MMSVAERANFIGGKWVKSDTAGDLLIEDPANEEQLAVVAESSPQDVDRAVAAARAAFIRASWRDMRSHRRSEILIRAADLIAARAEEFAIVESRDAGKPISDSRAIDIPEVIEVFRYMAGAPARLGGATLPVTHEGRPVLAYSERVPVGVCAAIVPWNFPLALTSYKVAAALAAGCSIVIKPSEEAPLSVLRLAELLSEAGVPDGVVNVVTGRGAMAGHALVDHPDIDKIAFTGSTAVGKSIMAAAAGSVKRISLEMGGKNPGIVFADADIERAAQGIAAAAFSNAGQICHCVERCYVDRRIADEFTGRLARLADAHILGDTLAATTTMGPLISRKHKASVARHVERAVGQGARIVTREAALPARGHFMRPIVFSHVPHDAPIAAEEIFGPVISVIPFDDEADALALANDTSYGLAASLWTRDVGRATWAARAITAGTVWVNGFGVLDAGLPFGGMKQSGLGRELSDEGVKAYTELKTTFIL